MLKPSTGKGVGKPKTDPSGETPRALQPNEGHSECSLLLCHAPKSARLYPKAPHQPCALTTAPFPAPATQPRPTPHLHSTYAPARAANAWSLGQRPSRKAIFSNKSSPRAWLISHANYPNQLGLRDLKRAVVRFAVNLCHVRVSHKSSNVPTSDGHLTIAFPEGRRRRRRARDEQSVRQERRRSRAASLARPPPAGASSSHAPRACGQRARRRIRKICGESTTVARRHSRCENPSTTPVGCRPPLSCATAPSSLSLSWSPCCSTSYTSKHAARAGSSGSAGREERPRCHYSGASHHRCAAASRGALSWCYWTGFLIRFNFRA